MSNEQQQQPQQPLRLRDVMTWDQIEAILDQHEEPIFLGRLYVCKGFVDGWYVGGPGANGVGEMFPTLAAAMAHALKLHSDSRS